MKRLLLSIGLILSFVWMPQALAQAPTSATLEFVPSTRQASSGQEFSVDVMLTNPGLQNIISVRAWLEYDPQLLEGVSIQTDGLPFTLAAPGENEFSGSDGLVKIGRSNVSGGFNQAETKVATIHFKVKSESQTEAQIKPHNYQTSELGHTSVNIIQDGFPVNILTTSPRMVSVSLNGNVMSTEIGGDEQIQTTHVGMANLNRPQNLKITTGPGYVDLKWDKGTEMGIEGYNIYYGKTSGEYSRRRTIALTDHYRIEGLNNGEVYYFAITAFDAEKKESDYSDEVAIIINQPLSSTSPFETFDTSKLSNVPAQPQNGPLMGWVGFSALGLGGVLAFRKREKLN